MTTPVDPRAKAMRFRKLLLLPALLILAVAAALVVWMAVTVPLAFAIVLSAGSLVAAAGWAVSVALASDEPPSSAPIEEESDG